MRTALAPDYLVEAELASGGMGVVFRAQEVALGRIVAVKVLRPELATAERVERFGREAKLLASLRHPNVVPIYHAGERDGLPYYTMPLFEGATLETRAVAGPLPVAEVVGIGRDILAALAVVHKRGIIHRDVKPANIFLVDGGALLGDFGIARLENAPDKLTSTGALLGTPAYMAPEQVVGAPATVRSDLYSLGAILYEALTGRAWVGGGAPLDWSGMPPHLARALRRATEIDPAARWPNAKRFARALTARPRSRRRWGIAALAVVLLVGIPAWAFGPACGWSAWRLVAGCPATALPRIGIQFTGLDLLPAAGLARFDRSLTLAGIERQDSATILVALSGGGAEPLEVHGALHEGMTPLLYASLWIPAGATPRAVADSLFVRLLPPLWRELDREDSLPSDLLPASARGMALWFRGERLFSEARWSEAHDKFRAALAEDATCLFCGWRLFIMTRWAQTPADSALVRRLAASAHRFPEPYRSVIVATTDPDIARRLDRLAEVTASHRRSYLPAFIYGDELMHRGPLFGHPRAAARDAFAWVTVLRAGFAPAWEHRAWIEIADGHEAEARAALDSLSRSIASGDATATALRSLIQAGEAFRFRDPAVAGALLSALLLVPEVRDAPGLGAGARYMNSFEAPIGGITLGRRFAAQRDRPDLRRSGLIAQSLAWVALGRPDSARAVAAELVRHFPERRDYAAALDRALIRAGEMEGIPPAGADLGPFTRAFRYLDQGDARLRAGDTTGARIAWLWHENNDVPGDLTDPAPIQAEGDWALATVAHWREAQADPRACHALRSVHRLWRAGDSAHQRRAAWADSVARRAECPA